MSDRSRRRDRANDSGAYVLNALDAADHDAFETHMKTSEDLRDEVTELNDTAVLLGMAVDPVTPSAALKESIMSKLSTTPQLPRELSPVREIRRAESENRASVVANPKAQARWFTRPVLVVAAAAAAVALLVGGGVAVALVNQGTQQEQQADALASITTAADYQKAVATISTGGKATLEWSLSRRKSALVVDGLKTLPSDKTYELWYISSKGVATPAGLFNPKSASTWRILTGTMSPGDTVGVTVEPSGGSKAPTTKPIVAIASA